MLTIWGRRNSVNVQKALWAAEECQLEFERKNIAGSFGFPENYQTINPNNVVPALTDGEVVLWESHTIVRYLARQQGELLGSSPAIRGQAEMWMDWALASLAMPFFQVFFPLIRTPEVDRNPVAIERGIKVLATLYQFIDGQLADRKYIAGNDFTVGDIPLGAYTYRYFNMDVSRPALPNVEAWYDRLQSRPAYQNRVMIPFGTNPDEWLALEKAGA